MLLEKNRKPGVKILMSGGTRCNITHDCDAAGIIAAFGSAGPFLHSPLASLDPHELVEMLNAEGLATKVEPGGKVFPQSDRAADVLNALLARLHRSGAELALGEPVNSIKSLSQNRRGLAHFAESSEQNVPVPLSANGSGIGSKREANGFCVETSRRSLPCEKLVITTGGKSYPGCGTVGDGYRWLASLGHTIRRPRPALVPLTSDEMWVHELAGITIADVVLRVVDPTAVEMPKGKRRRGGLPPGVLIERRGSLLFTHFGLSGPAVLDVSRAVTGAANPRELLLAVDFLPARTADELEQHLRDVAAKDGKRFIVGNIAEELPRRLLESVMARAGIPLDRRLAEFSATERPKLIAQLKRCEIRVTGSRGFEKAEVTAGGVALDEVDSRTMQSKLAPGLFLAGEILDLDGFIGGYNFQAAFSTGWLAGESV